MALPSFPYTLSNGTTGDADEVMANFNLIKNNFDQDSIEDASASNAEFQATKLPSTSSKPTSGREELQTLRYQVLKLMQLLDPTIVTWDEVPVLDVYETYYYDVSLAFYTDKYADASSEEGQSHGLAFSSDGTKMYVVGQVNKTVYQYTLTTAWDVSTASYASKSVSVNAEDTLPSAIYFSSDGTKMFIAGDTNNSIFQYSLTTAWDVSTASYASKSVSVSAQLTALQGLSFSSDGTKMYVTGNSAPASVYQYTLTTAWDVSTASYASKSCNVSTEDSIPRGVAFSSDGTKMFIAGDANNSIFQYNLTTPWDVSTASYASKSYDVSNITATPYDLAFDDNGAKMYVLGNLNDYVYQYNVNGIFLK